MQLTDHAGLTVEEIGSVVWSFLNANHAFDDPDVDGVVLLGVPITDTTAGTELLPGCSSDLLSRFDLVHRVADSEGDPGLVGSELECEATPDHQQRGYACLRQQAIAEH